MQSLFIKHRYILVAALLLALSWLSYSGNNSHELLAWDDAPYVTNNNWVTNPSPDALIALFTESKVANWHPLTWLSYIPEYYFCETNASCYKTTNIFLHAANSFLIFLLATVVLQLLMSQEQRIVLQFGALTDERLFAASLMSAILFCVHPQHAESVIWVAERKDLLSALFYLLALLFYIFQQNAATSKNPLLPFILFILAIMSKSMAITLPAILVLLDFTLLGRWPVKGSETRVKALYRVVIVEKIHYYLVAVAVAFVTLASQDVAAVEQPTLFERLMICLAAIEHYLFSFFAPVNLSPFYPVEIVSESIVDYWFSLIALVLFFGLVLYERTRRVSALLLGYFFITLSPVIGIIKVGDQAFADRYTYLSMIGFCILVAFVVCEIIDRERRSRVPVFVGFALLAGYLALSTNQYKNTWQNDLVLWTTVERDYPRMSVTISDNLGLAHLASGNYVSAKENFEFSIALDPQKPRAYVNLAAAHQQLGEVESFLNTFAEGVANNPTNAELISSAGFGFLNYNLDDQALEYFIQALELELNFPPALMGVGNLLLKRGEPERAIEMLELVPEDSDVEFTARILQAQAYGRIDKARSMSILGALRAKYGRDSEIDYVVDYVNRL